MKKEIYEKYKYFCKQYKLTGYNVKKLWNIIRPICYHKEFIKRSHEPFWHHDCKTIGENKHGFIHPIEAVVNAITWFPNIFLDEHDSLMIIDGIIHHMYPFQLELLMGPIYN